MKTEAKIIEEFPNYSITKKGEIENLKTKKILNPYESNGGYIGVRLTKKGKVKNLLIHRLVALTFIPNPENKKEVNHKNGIKNDNRAENLEWCSSSENTLHAFKLGLMSVKKGEECNLHKLKKNEVILIREKLEKNISHSIIAKEFNISSQTILDIKNKKTWKHV